MSVFDRPYAGNWAPNRRKVTRYTPDAILMLNGDTKIPGHKPERQVIDIQKFVTQMSVDAGVDSGSASASFTLSIPKDIGSSLFSDGHSVFQPGLEVHIYMRGYFPVEGLANTLSKKELESLEKALGATSKDLAMRPYYHCFHGVTSTANLEYSGGFYSINQSCTGMLHFWQYHDISTNASLFGTRPTGSKLKMSLVGHNFTNMSPFSIIYSLYKDTAGAAGGVAFALSASSNQSKKFFGENKSLFEMTQLYWEQRFQSKMYNLRMFGVNGEQLNSAQTAMIGRMSTSQLKAAAAINQRHRNNTRTAPASPEAPLTQQTVTSATTTGRQYTNASFSRSMLQYLARAGEGSGYAVSAAQLKAFVNDIGQWGNVNLFESSYTSKLDIASAAATAVGYEFFQDVDGDLVFKPPLYNMDTSGLEAYRIEPEDVISITRASAEPQCTYMTVKSGQFSNMKGLGLEGEWGVRGQYIDYRLVAKYGWRPGDLDAQFYSDARGAFWAAVARMDVLNEAMETANITIPLRPELRPGFPVYVRHLDCFYYVKSMSHSFSYGGQCTTSLQCVAQRKKFLPPGAKPPATENVVGNGVDHVDLSRPDKPSIPLVVADGTGGEVKLVGFPNVVMALDPDAVSPLAWAFGEDVIDLRSTDAIKNILMKLVGANNKPVHSVNVRQVDPNTGEVTTDPLVMNGLVLTTIQGARSTSANVESTFTGTDSNAGFIVQVVNDDETAFEDKTLTIGEIRSQLAGYQKFLEDLIEGDQSKAEASVPGSQAYRDAQERYKQQLNEEVLGSATPDPKKASIFDLLQTLTFIQRAEAGDDMGTLNSAQILDLLGDKKANFSNASTPGYYRYYSSASPVPDDQAPFVYVARNTAYGLERVLEDKHKVMSTYASGMFKSGQLNPPSTIMASQTLRERYVEWDTSSTANVRQFRVAGSGGTTNDVHTDEIYTLMFAKGAAKLEAMVAKGTRQKPKFTNLQKVYEDAILNHLGDSIGTIPMDATLQDAYSGFFETIANCKMPGSGKVANNENVSDTLRQQGFSSTPWFRIDGVVVDNPLRQSGAEGSGGFTGFPEFSWTNVLSGGYRLTRSDQDLAGTRTTQHDMATTKLVDVPRVLDMVANKKVYLWDSRNNRKRNRADKVYPYQRSSDLRPEHLKNAYVSDILHQHVAKKLASRVLTLLTKAAKAWVSEFSGRYSSDEAKNAWLEFQGFAQAFNGAVGFTDDSKGIGGTKYGDWSVQYTVRSGYKKATSVLSPVFPVSDAGGYRHFGSYAYGRGVTVDVSQQGWEMLLSKDPLSEIDSSVVDEFVRGIIRNGANTLANTVYRPTGSDPHAMVKALLELQKTNPAAFSRATRSLKLYEVNDGVETSKTVEDVLQEREARGIQTSGGLDQELLAIGLINHFRRDDTPGAFTTPLNASHNLVDIMPGRGTDPSAGDEVLFDSLVKLAAGDPNSFIYVTPEGEDGNIQANVVKQVQNQMIVNSATHFDYQEELRGKRELPRSTFDFNTMFENWGQGDGLWEDSELGSAYEKLSQVFNGETPDDPKLKAIYQRLSDINNTLENTNIGEQYEEPRGSDDPREGGDSGGGVDQPLTESDNPEPEDDISGNLPRDVDDPSATREDGPG